MNRIEKLIQELCPNGVPFYPLSTVATVKTGDVITKKKIQESPGPFPVINSGKQPLGYVADFNAEDEPIGVASRGSVGWVSWSPGKIFRGSLNYGVVPDKNKVDERFLYFVMKSKDAEIQQLSTHEGIPALNKSNLVKFQVPVPPIEVQREIVKILDLFTELEAELEAEFEARRKQYEHYRDQLLELEEWPQVALDDAFILRGGYTPAKSNKEYWEDGTIPWIRMDDLRLLGTRLNTAQTKVNEAAVKKGGPFDPGSFAVATTATIGDHALVQVPFLANQQFTVLTLKPEWKQKFDLNFLYFYFFKLGDWCRQNVRNASIPTLDRRKFKSFQFPCPPIEVQREIADVLDKFDALVNDLSSGLPAEIEARRKQYEYYRDKLLTFKELQPEAA